VPALLAPNGLLHLPRVAGKVELSLLRIRRKRPLNAELPV
jgi:hypothetical protein